MMGLPVVTRAAGAAHQGAELQNELSSVLWARGGFIEMLSGQNWVKTHAVIPTMSWAAGLVFLIFSAWSGFKSFYDVCFVGLFLVLLFPRSRGTDKRTRVNAGSSLSLHSINDYGGSVDSESSRKLETMVKDWWWSVELDIPGLSDLKIFSGLDEQK